MLAQLMETQHRGSFLGGLPPIKSSGQTPKAARTQMWIPMPTYIWSVKTRRGAGASFVCAQEQKKKEAVVATIVLANIATIDKKYKRRGQCQVV